MKSSSKTQRKPQREQSNLNRIVIITFVIDIITFLILIATACGWIHLS